MKTEELQGAALDWAVAMCEGRHPDSPLEPYSVNWSWGGPIIDRERMTLRPVGKTWSSDMDPCYRQYGPNPLIAAMRCYVASKLGDEVEIPEELK
jgi:hypothetical protein